MTNRTFRRVVVEIVIEEIHKDTIDYFMEEVWANCDSRLGGYRVTINETREDGE